MDVLKINIRPYPASRYLRACAWKVYSNNNDNTDIKTCACRYLRPSVQNRLTNHRGDREWQKQYYAYYYSLLGLTDRAQNTKSSQQAYRGVGNIITNYDMRIRITTVLYEFIKKNILKYV